MLGQKGHLKEIAGKERRRFPRVQAQIPVYFKTGASKTQVTGITRDVSPYGLQLYTKKADIRPNDKIRFVAPEGQSPGLCLDFQGSVIWTDRKEDATHLGLVFDNNMEEVINYLLLLAFSEDTLLGSSFFQLLLDSLPDPAILLDNQLRIKAISSNQPILPCDPSILVGEKIGEAPTILKQLASPEFEPRKAMAECLFKRHIMHFSALPLNMGRDEEAEKRYFNVLLKPVSVGHGRDMIFVQIRDVTMLCKLKEKIRERNNALWSQYKFMTMGQIVDELLEDLISPLSAIVGRLDLLTMKMNSVYESGGKVAVGEWLKELQIIDGLVEQITEFCTVAAKRREREKLGSMVKTISFNKLIEETLLVLKPKSSFRAVNIHLRFKTDLPEFQGDYFDWLNALIALFQTIIKEMDTLSHKEMTVITDVQEEWIILSISHNARALKIPLEREMGLGILEVLREKYGVSIKTHGDNGSQTIVFRVRIQEDVR